jgi:hypothetical protein
MTETPWQRGGTRAAQQPVDKREDLHELAAQYRCDAKVYRARAHAERCRVNQARCDYWLEAAALCDRAADTFIVGPQFAVERRAAA